MIGSMSLIHRILPFARLVRYRFFLVAGLFPFFLGVAIAEDSVGEFLLKEFLIALAGLFFILVAVEAFNEHFDSRLGSDRVFERDPKTIPAYVLKLGLVSFFLAGCAGAYLLVTRGAFITVFILFGFLAAAFYVGPPIRWAYRGMGELMIALSYGPFMTVGSYYVMTQRVDVEPVFASLLPATLVFGLAIINAVPDYYGDRLVGKKNIVVRLGRRRGIVVFSWTNVLFFVLVTSGLVADILPLVSCLILGFIPLSILNCKKALKFFNNPTHLIPVIRGTVLIYVGSLSVLVVGFLTR